MSDIVDVYPFSTQDGKAIPLDILKPAWLFLHGFSPDASTSLTLSDANLIGVFISSESVIISFDAALDSPLVAGMSLPKALYVPKGVIVTSVIPSQQLHARAVDTAGTLYIQLIEKWAGLALAKQYVRK